MENKEVLEKLAKVYAGFKSDQIIDSDEQYYRTTDYKIYKAFLKGAETQQILSKKDKL